ncbi:MAG: phosphoribosyltransferase [candidate division Zixibacteria bacterium]|nr:phosphoribosyltransferase [candidate division Zixibacteria bacterium]
MLIDWRYHHGRTLSTLARMLRRSGAEVVRFVWLR